MKIKMLKGMNTRVSDNFMSSEYQCKCNGLCSFAEIEEELIEAVQSLRAMFKGPLHITSAYRCAGHNDNVGGVENSTHVRGMAVDIVCDDLDRLALIIEGVYPEFSIGRYDTFIHFDIRRDSRRWDNRTESYLPDVPEDSYFHGRFKDIEDSL